MLKAVGNSPMIQSWSHTAQVACQLLRGLEAIENLYWCSSPSLHIRIFSNFIRFSISMLKN